MFGRKDGKAPDGGRKAPARRQGGAAEEADSFCCFFISCWNVLRRWLIPPLERFYSAGRTCWWCSRSLGGAVSDTGGAAAKDSSGGSGRGRRDQSNCTGTGSSDAGNNRRRKVKRQRRRRWWRWRLKVTCEREIRPPPSLSGRPGGGGLSQAISLSSSPSLLLPLLLSPL